MITEIQQREDDVPRLRQRQKEIKEQRIRFEEVPSVEDLPDNDVQDPNQEVPMFESPKREVKLRKIKKYQYNAWEDIKNRQAGVTFEQLRETAPTIKRQTRSGLVVLNLNSKSWKLMRPKTKNLKTIQRPLHT